MLASSYYRIRNAKAFGVFMGALKTVMMRDVGQPLPILPYLLAINRKLNNKGGGGYCIGKVGENISASPLA